MGVSAKGLPALGCEVGSTTSGIVENGCDRLQQIGLEVAPRDRRLRNGLRELFIIRITNLVRLKQHDDAVLVAEQLTREYPSHAPGHAWLGSTYARLGRRDEATQAFRRALELDPENARARRELRMFRRSRR